MIRASFVLPRLSEHDKLPLQVKRMAPKRKVTTGSRGVQDINGKERKEMLMEGGEEWE